MAVYFEDFQVGHRYPAAEVEVTLAMIKEFAAAYDPQPIHLDQVAAREGFFGQLVGSGWHTAALTMRLMVDCKPFGNQPVIGLGVNDIKFSAPLKPGDTLSAVGEITKSWRSKSKPFGYFSIHVTTTNQDGEVVLSQTWTVMVPARE